MPEWPEHGPVAVVGANGQLDAAQLVARVAQLTQRLEIRPAFAHAVKSLTAEVELAGSQVAASLFRSARDILRSLRY